jgi:hypothetical protein
MKIDLYRLMAVASPLQNVGPLQRVQVFRRNQ